MRYEVPVAGGEKKVEIVKWSLEKVRTSLLQMHLRDWIKNFIFCPQELPNRKYTDNNLTQLTIKQKEVNKEKKSESHLPCRIRHDTLSVATRDGISWVCCCFSSSETLPSSSSNSTYLLKPGCLPTEFCSWNYLSKSLLIIFLCHGSSVQLLLVLRPSTCKNFSIFA